MERIAWADGQLVDTGGAATWLLDRRPVLGWRLGPVTVDGRLAPTAPLTADWQVDELEQVTTAGPVRIALRHSLDRTWGIRLSVVNTGPDAVRVDRLGLLVTTGPEWVGWATRAGAEGSVVALPCRTGDPLLGFGLVQGELRGTGPDLVVGPLELPAGAQQVVRLRGETYGSARDFARGRHDLLPAWGWVEARDEVQVHHPDLAVVTGPAAGGGSDPGEVAAPDVSTMTGDPGDTTRLVLAGPRGLVDVEVGFAPALETVVDRFVAAGERSWPTGRQGTRIPSAAAALVVQHQLASPSRGGRPVADWAEAVEGVCARLTEQSPSSAGSPAAFAVALLARQAMLTGDPELAERATSGCARVDAGLPLVAPEVLAARRLTGLAPVLPVRTGERLAADRGPELQPTGARWGLGLRGGRLAPDDPVGDGRMLALARMQAVLHPPRPHRWACGAEELLDRQDRRIRHQLWQRMWRAPDSADDPVVADALAWLVLTPTG